MSSREHEAEATLVAGVIGVAAVLAFVTAVVLYEGWVVSVLWNWFVAPTYARSIDLAHGMGFSLLAGVVLFRPVRPKCGEEYRFAAALFSPILMLGCGWVVRQFI